MPEAGYWAPARYVLTVLRRKGDAPDCPVEPACAEPIDGWTACCGRAMLQSESWVAVERRDGDSLCEGDGPGSVEIAATEEAAGLW